MQQTLSSTPLEAVLVAPRGDVTDVWLRRNIIHDWHSEPDDTAQEFWQADEAHGTMPAGTTKEQVAADFDVLWEVFERSAMTEQEREASAVAREQATAAILGSSGDGTTAPRNVIEGELVITGGRTYVAIENLARGERLRVGANVRATTLTEYIMEQSNKDKE